MHPIIKVVDLWKQYPEAGQNGSYALRGTYLEVAAGELIAIYGKSGSGKTTLLNLLAGLDHPTKGLIEVEGHNIALLGEKGKLLWILSPC